MSAWRRRASEVFPERVADRAAKLSATAFFAALAFDLRAVYAGAREEPDLADRIFAFVEWSLRPGQASGLRRAAVDGLLLRLPNVAEGRRDVAVRVRPTLFAELEPRYRSALPLEAYAAPIAEVERVRYTGSDVNDREHR